MNASGIFRQLSATSGAVGLCAMLCALIAHLTREEEAARGLLLSGLLSIFFGLFWMVLVRDAKSRAGPREALWFVLGFWLLTPMIAAPAFWSSGVVGSWDAAYFEAVSNLTTTGSTLGSPSQPDAIRLWRACLQLIGGVCSVLILVVVLAALNASGAGVNRSHLLTFQRDDIFGRYNKVALVVGAVYVSTTIVGVIWLLLGGANIVDAITRAIAACTTSNTLPGAGELAVYSTWSIIGLVVLLFVGTTNVARHADLFRSGGIKNAITDNETVYLICAVIVLGLVLCLDKSGFDARLFAEALSFLSTSGISVSGVEGVHQRLPQPTPEILAFVGGSALSTAGGLKIARLLLLSQRAGIEFRRLAYVNAIAPLRYRGLARKDAVIMGVWVYLIAYIGAIVAVGLGLTFFNVDLDVAARAAVGAVTNTGPLMDVAVYDQAPSTGVLNLLCLGCLLGRIEVLALAPLFTLDFWRK